MTTVNMFNSLEYNGYILNPDDNWVYLYNSLDGSANGRVPFTYGTRVMNAGLWHKISNGMGMESKTASVQDDLTSLADVFTDEYVPGENITYQDVAKNIYQETKHAKYSKDINRMAAVITSKDYEIFQVPTILGTNAVNIRTGVLAQQFEEVSTPQLFGKWATETDDLIYHTFVPEGTTVDPSKGGAEGVDIFVPKHEGAVAITTRAQMIIGGADPLTRLTQRLAQARLKKENAMVAAEIQSNTAHTTAGVDFGAVTGSPPASTTNPAALWTTLLGLFDALNKGQLNLFVSKAFIFNEYLLNDKVRGVGSAGGPPLPTISNVNEQSSAVPGISGVTWVRDNAITSSTDMWAMDRNAIKNFRGPTTTFNITTNDLEATKNVLRSYYLCETVDSDLIYQITAVAA